MAHHKPVYPMPTEGELVDFPHGAAGHQGISSNAAGDLIIKPCTQAEIDFYEAARKHPDFQALMPVYMGKLELGNHAAQSEGQSGKEHNQEKRKSKAWIPSGGKKIETGLAIVLENTTSSFKRPNVMDLKLGTRLWDENAPEEKRKRLDQVAADTTSGSLGFRVAGAKIWLGDAAQNADIEVNTEIKDGYKSYNKHYGQKLNENTVHQAIARFLSGTVNPTTFATDKSWLGSEEAVVLTSRLIKEVEHIQYVLEHEESRMYSASILVVIEGDPEALKEALATEQKLKEEEENAPKQAADGPRGTEEENEEEEEDEDEDDEEEEVGPKVMEVRLIDFAHASFTPGQGPDENALKGVRNIIQILKEINN